MERLSHYSCSWTVGGVCLLLIAFGSVRAHAQPVWEEFNPSSMVEVLSYLDGEVPNVHAFVERLRKHGPASVDRLCALRSHLESEREEKESIPERATITVKIEALEQLIDQVCHMRWASRMENPLFWYTDFDSAVAEAKKEDRELLILFVADDLLALDGDGSAALLNSAVYFDRKLNDRMTDFVLYQEFDSTNRMVEGDAANQNLPPIHMRVRPNRMAVNATYGIMSSNVLLNRFGYRSLASMRAAQRFSSALDSPPLEVQVLLSDIEVAKVLEGHPKLKNISDLPQAERCTKVDALLIKDIPKSQVKLVQACFADAEDDRDFRLMHARIRQRAANLTNR